MSHLVSTTATAGELTEDFEGSSSGSTTPPDGWTLVTVNSSPASTYTTTNGYTGAGLGGAVTGNSWNNSHDGLPGGYIVNSGSAAFDAAGAITGSFAFRVKPDGSKPFYAAATFIMGDVQTGFTGSDAGQLVGAKLCINTFGPKAIVMDGAADQLAGTINLSAETWYQAEFSWTPSDGTTGEFSYTVKTTSGSTVGSLTASTTLTSSDVYFGFGSAQPNAYGPVTGTFDDISITGVTPTPSATMLLLK